MSDVRGLPKGSKALTVVVFVVFFQVLVVAVFGLNSMLGDQAEAERKALEQADAKARGALAELVLAVRDDVVDLLESAAAVEDVGDLQALARLRPERLVLAVYQVDPETREVWWIDGEHRLHVPPDVRDRRIAEERSKAADRSVEDLERAGKLEFMREYTYLVDKDGYPFAVGAALELLDLDLEPEPPPGVRRVYETYERRRLAVLGALEVAALNRENPSLSETDALLIDKLEATVESVVAGLPVARGEKDRVTDEAIRLADALRLEAGEFRSAGRGLEAQGFLEAMVTALPKAVRGAVPADRRPRVVPRGVHLVGLVPAPREGRFVAVRLDAAGLLRRIESRADLVALAELGVELRLVAEDAPVDADPTALASRPLAAEGVVLPYRGDLRRVHAPATGGFGPSALFYWGIIAGAVGGLALGGYVLVRTIRREMRVARLKADFVSNLSHELKTPLTSITMFTEMLREGKLSTSADREEAYDVLTQESSRLQRIVGRMMDTARREAQAEPCALRPGDLNRPVREAALRMRRIVTEPGLDLVQDLTPDPLPVLLDEAALDDAVTNLLSNAWKYRQGDRARIVVRTRRLRRKAEIVVSDDGIGIPRSERRKVFEMFYRAEQYLSRAVPGTGLGLALVRTIVRSHRGKIRIEPGEGGRGSLFRVRLPLARGLAAPAAGSPAPAASAAHAAPRQAEV